MKPISIRNASEKNLRHISLDIPRGSLTVFTGLSGSGKSTLLIDVLYMECQRQYLEAMSFQGIAKPAVERVQNASPAVVITQTDQNRNPRSTVGTVTDLYTGLRMLYEKLGRRFPRRTAGRKWFPLPVPAMQGKNFRSTSTAGNADRK